MFDVEKAIEARRAGPAPQHPAQAAWEPRRWLAWHRGDGMPFDAIACLVGRPAAVVEAAVRDVLEADAAADVRDQSGRSCPMAQQQLPAGGSHGPTACRGARGPGPSSPR